MAKLGQSGGEFGHLGPRMIFLDGWQPLSELSEQSGCEKLISIFGSH